jgi:hypothetical protein
MKPSHCTYLNVVLCSCVALISSLCSIGCSRHGLRHNDDWVVDLHNAKSGAQCLIAVVKESRRHTSEVTRNDIDEWLYKTRLGPEATINYLKGMKVYFSNAGRILNSEQYCVAVVFHSPSRGIDAILFMAESGEYIVVSQGDVSYERRKAEMLRNSVFYMSFDFDGRWTLGSNRGQAVGKPHANQ